MNAGVVLTALLIALAVPAEGQDGDRHLADAAASSVRARLTIFDFVTVSVDAGTVTLTGTVTLPQKKEELGRRIADLEGVHHVRNDIRVLPTSAADEELRTRVARAIYGNAAFWRYAALPTPPIHIVVENGDVTLLGMVSGESERALAQSLATGLGARSVTNALRTQVAAR